MTTANDTVYETLKRNSAADITRIQEFLRQPSVASSNTGGPEGATLLASYYKALGCQEVEILPTDGFPGVFAYLDSGAANTIISYCMYDTKPPQRDKWSVDPYAAALTEMEDLGRAVLAPGAKSRKAPYMQWLNAMQALIEVDGKLPVNVIFLAEGEENVGSPHYSAFVDRYANRLTKAIGCFVPGASQSAEGELTVHLGYKGLVYARVTASGKRMGRGPQNVSGHGMAQVVADSPAWRLVAALNTLFDGAAQQVRVKGFYDTVQPPTDVEKAELAELANRYEGMPWNKIAGGVGDAVSSWADKSPQELLAQYLYMPSFNLNGLSAGFTGPGAPVFTLPAEASAYLDIRLPRGCNTKETIALVRRQLDESGFSDVDFEVLAAHEPSHTDQNSPFVSIVEYCVRDAGYEVAYQPYSSGGGPWSRFASEFGLPVLFDVGLGHGGRGGAADEYLVLESQVSAAGNTECEYFYAKLINGFAHL